VDHLRFVECPSEIDVLRNPTFEIDVEAKWALMFLTKWHFEINGSGHFTEMPLMFVLKLRFVRKWAFLLDVIAISPIYINIMCLVFGPHRTIISSSLEPYCGWGVASYRHYYLVRSTLSTRSCKLHFKVS
jgi:hypothetical protein